MRRIYLLSLFVALLSVSQVLPAVAVKMQCWDETKENSVLKNSSKMKRGACGNVIFLPEFDQSAPLIQGEFPNERLRRLWIATLKRSNDLAPFLEKYKLKPEDLPMPYEQTFEYAHTPIGDFPFGFTVNVSSSPRLIPRTTIFDKSLGPTADRLRAAYVVYCHSKPILNANILLGTNQYKNSNLIETSCFEIVRKRMEKDYEKLSKDSLIRRQELIDLAGLDAVEELDLQLNAFPQENPPMRGGQGILIR